jgi:predicted transcriptional regulator
MACINPDGTLTPTARKVLETLQQPLSLADLARVTGLPLYRIRMSLRELLEAGLLKESHSEYQATPAGLEKLAA